MQSILTQIANRLGSKYDSRELSAVSKSICTEILGISQSAYFLKDRIQLSGAQQKLLVTTLVRLEKGEPLQYVIGVSPFCGLQFVVNEDVLIPRPETAELVDWILSDYRETGLSSVLDIGTGSGCIAITLSSHFPDCCTDAYDVSAEALKVAAKNNEINATGVNLYQVDILLADRCDKKYDVIVSNPPYIADFEKDDMDDNVLLFEPHTALFVPNDNPLLFYRVIAEFGKKNLKRGGALYFEINPLFANQMLDLLKDYGYRNVELRKDIYGKDRMIKANIYD